MEKMIKNAVNEFQMKVFAKQFYQNMVEGFYLDATKENEDMIYNKVCKMIYYVYASGEVSITLQDETEFSFAALTRVVEFLMHDFKNEIKKTIFTSNISSPQRCITTIQFLLNKEAIVEWYYMQLAKSKLDK